MFRCKNYGICGKSFEKNYQFHNHYKNCLIERICPMCPSRPVFKSESGFKSHAKIHRVYVFPEIIRSGRDLELPLPQISFSTDVSVPEIVHVDEVRDGEVCVGVECEVVDVNVSEHEKLVSEVEVGVVGVVATLVCDEELVSEVEGGVVEVDAAVLCGEGRNVSDVQDGVGEVNLAVMCDGECERRKEIEDGYFALAYEKFCEDSAKVTKNLRRAEDRFVELNQCLEDTIERFKERVVDEEWEVAAVLEEEVRNGVEHVKIRWANSWLPTEQARVAAPLKIDAFKKRMEKKLRKKS